MPFFAPFDNNVAPSRGFIPIMFCFVCRLFTSLPIFHMHLFGPFRDHAMVSVRMFVTFTCYFVV